MINTTLCYIEREEKYLMLHRIKKENDQNRDKWLGIGGKFENRESPFDCAKREISEETGLLASSLEYRGIVTFVSDEYGTEYMHLFKCRDFSGAIKDDCNEGVLEWIEKKRLYELPMWEGDRIFLELLDKESPFFSLKLVYSGERLIEHTLNVI